jgi:hypothetical protein
MFAWLNVLKLDHIPVKFVSNRWNMTRCAELIPQLTSTTTSNRVLRAKLWGDHAQSKRQRASTPEFGLLIVLLKPVKRTVTTTQKKTERLNSGTLGRSDVEKYSMVTALLQPLIADLVGSSSPIYYEKMILLQNASGKLCAAFTAL